MTNAEMIYQKACQLDAFRLQEVADFIDFLLSKTKQAENVKKISENKSGTKALLESELVGCADADPKLSRNYKTELSTSLDEKYGYR